MRDLPYLESFLVLLNRIPSLNFRREFFYMVDQAFKLSMAFSSGSEQMALGFGDSSFANEVSRQALA
jgi:hypothetical protein